MKYEAVIGLEIHCELKTKTKIFCGCATGFGAEQNTHVCPVCLGLPGVLPTVNKRVVEFGIKAGLATNCTINKYSKFDRKNYYYPDLPKNWQTSQYDLPIAEHGWVDIDVDGEKKRIRLTRIHMEEDAGKLVHSGTTIKDSATSNVDYNRTGVPLLEIVSEPDLRSAEEARAYMEKIKAIMEYIDVSNCRMEEGNLRADINVSLRPAGTKELGTRTEMKNINSFKNLEDAITSLPPKCREVFMMSYIENLPNKDISARLGISLSTVENHIYSALKQLRVALAKDKAFLLFTLLPYLGDLLRGMPD